MKSVGVRQKGHGSRDPRKPSIKVKFDKFTDGQTLLSLKGFGLKANTQDASQLRQRVAMDIFKRVGIYAPRQSSAELFLNGEFFGVFEVDEDVDKVFLKRTLGESNGNLYEAEGLPSYFFEYLGEDPGLYVPIHFSPESPDSPDTTALVSFIRAINQSSDEDFASAVGAFLDWKQMLTELAVENYIADFDGIAGVGGINNFYLYQYKGTNKFLFIPKDKDMTFGYADQSVFERYDQNVLLRRAMNNPALRKIYLDALMEVAATTGYEDGWAIRKIDEYADQIRAAVYADPNKICFQSECTNEAFEYDVFGGKWFVATRLDSILDQIKDQQPSTALMYEGGIGDALTGSPVLTPNGYFSIYGTNLPTENLTVLINGYSAALLYTSAVQINGFVPGELATGKVPVIIRFPDGTTNMIFGNVNNNNP
ncbi:CotH kinase family protein [Bryobacter aggregatus]|uniref:CotH kinase family protein n=1 Tax=Bryobacter aggregatus TaxID=360054 RepID=UPI00138E0BD1|nr:CotH kinase family protein [Bryobacter aggregatus]